MAEVRLERNYQNSPVEVFTCWTDIDVLRTWFGCGPDLLWQVHAWEPQVGGEIHVSQSFEDRPYEERGRFVVVDPPSHLRYEWGEGDIVDVRFEATEPGTRLILTHIGPGPDQFGDILTGGWTVSVAALGEAAAALRIR